MPKLITIVMVCTLLALLTGIYSFGVNPDGDAAGNIMFFLGLIGFPMSVLPTLAVLSTVGTLFPPASNSLVFYGICLSYLAAILVQWFWLVPRFTRYFHERRNNK
jgi:hypothetical protein